ncbi:MAG: hypothetical protein LBP87_15970 [Planctomycetaceae bacterium]|jgi:hypothetical protein|nr:hypothetical protein [Planctomycetaceae bacterium]
MSEPKKMLHSLVDELPEESYGQVIDYILYVKNLTKKQQHETLFLSEKSLAKDWLSQEENLAWADL